MEPPVTAALISSCVALAVAVIGVIATGVVQTRATTKAHANALAMFEKEAAERVDMFTREVDEQRKLAHLAHKRGLYAQLLRLMDEYQAGSRWKDPTAGSAAG